MIIDIPRSPVAWGSSCRRAACMEMC